jgi:hypothetical protein
MEQFKPKHPGTVKHGDVLVIFGPPVIRDEAVPLGPSFRVPLQSIAAFMGLDGNIHVGFVNTHQDGEEDPYKLSVWLGDITIEIELPALALFVHANEGRAKEAGLLVGKTFAGWAEFAVACKQFGYMVNIAYEGEDVFD